MEIVKIIKRIARYMLLVGVLFLLIGLFMEFDLHSCSFTTKIEGFIGETNKTESFDLVEELYIQAEGAKIDFTTDETATQITVNYYADDEEVFVEFGVNEENKLSITQKFSNHISVKKGGVFKITLPENHKFTNVELHINATELKVNDLQTENLELSVDAGDIHFSKVVAMNLELSVNAGDIHFSKVVAMNLKANINAGNFECYGLLSDRVNTSVNAGNITLEVVGISSEYTVTSSAALGQAATNQTGTTDKYIRAKVDLGNVDIVFKSKAEQ